MRERYKINFSFSLILAWSTIAEKSRAANIRKTSLVILHLKIIKFTVDKPPLQRETVLKSLVPLLNYASSLWSLQLYLRHSKTSLLLEFCEFNKENRVILTG